MWFVDCSWMCSVHKWSMNYVSTWRKTINELRVYLKKSNQRTTCLPEEKQSMNYVSTWRKALDVTQGHPMHEYMFQLVPMFTCLWHSCKVESALIPTSRFCACLVNMEGGIKLGYIATQMEMLSHLWVLLLNWSWNCTMYWIVWHACSSHYKIGTRAL